MTTPPPHPRHGRVTILRTLDKIRYRLEQHGPAWIPKRLRFELATPTTMPGKALFSVRHAALHWARAPFRALLRRLNATLPGEDETMYAFYDLAVAPVTYDAVFFTAAADVARRRAACRHLHFVVVPGRLEGFREEFGNYEAFVDREARRWRIQNILLPIFGLLEATAGMTVAASRDEAGYLRDRVRAVFPDRYDPALPTYSHTHEVISAARAGEATAVLRAPKDARHTIDRYFRSHAGDRKVLTITLRDYGFGAARNSNHAAWAAFSRALDPAEWFAVFVPETARTVEPPRPELEGLAMLPEAAWNVGLRLALYEAADLNMSVNTGPIYLASFAPDAPNIVFKLVEESVDQTTTEYMESLGFVPGETPSCVNRFTRWVWEDDDEATLRREFEAMAPLIEDRRAARAGAR